MKNGNSPSTALGARLRLLAALAALLSSTVGAAQTSTDYGARPAPLPRGLASVWRVDGRKLDTRASAWSLAAFSTDGQLVGVSDDGGTRIYRASDGRLVRMFPPPFSTGQFTFSLAISSTGLVALGRVGGVEIQDLERAEPTAIYHCGGVCGPVSAVAFSQSGAWLAYQAARGMLEPTPGLVGVVDLRAHERIAQLEASTSRAGVSFTADDRTLLAANVTRIDDSGTFGFRAWNAGADWQRIRDMPGRQAPRGSVGPFAFNERVTIYSREGRIELREVASGELVWSVPLVPPGLDAVGEDVPMKLDLVAFAPRGALVLSYESPVSGAGPGAIVLRRMGDGGTVAMYDVTGVSALAWAPDGGSFVYSTGAGRTYTALARVPR